MKAPHKNIQKQLSVALDNGRIAHALLFNGDLGNGSLLLAHWYAKQLLTKDKPNPNFTKIDELNHPDYHFCFPVTDTNAIKKPLVSDLMPEWREFIKLNPAGSLYDWMSHLDVEKKQGKINVRLAKEIIEALSLRSYEGGYRIMLVWLPETMNAETANKLLKIIEEPPKKTVFLLVTEQVDALLPTLVSRCQVVNVPNIPEIELKEVLVENYGVDQNLVQEILPKSKGNIQRAREYLLVENAEFEEYFIQWVRAAFMAKTKVSALQDILQWSVDISSWSRDRQKQFLDYAINIFREALMESYGANDLVLNSVTANGFKWLSFAQFIHGANISEILQEITDASYHIERNANAKIVFLDLGIKLTRYIHRKAS